MNSCNAAVFNMLTITCVCCSICSAIKLITPGFCTFMPWLLPDDDVPISYTVGQTISISQVIMDQKETSPPDYLTEAELIGLVSK